MNNFNYRSNEWIVLRERLTTDLTRYLDELANPDCPVDRTNFLRGRISYVKELLAEERAAGQHRPRD